MIREKLCVVAGLVGGSWDCCNGTVGCRKCAEETNHDSLFRECFLDQSVVMTTHEGQDAGPAKVFALDCEMVNTSRGKEVARVTLLNFHGESCYETLVKPPATIVDYKTKYSGITEAMLEGVTTTLADVQKSLLGQISSKDIIVGHGLDNDLRCLHLEHRKVRQEKSIFFTNLPLDRLLTLLESSPTQPAHQSVGR